MKQPNVIFVFGDQWRAQATGYAGNPNVQTPNLDDLSKGSVNFTNAVSGCPVCSPYRASLLTGQYPLTHGVFVNDVYLKDEAVSLAEAFSDGGYDTAYIGKWHVDGHGRSNYIPSERRQGFDYWKVLECTHNYNNSPYYSGDSDEKLFWEGYDAIAQTRDAQNYIRKHSKETPFLLAISWGPPHAPYHTAPEEYQALYNPGDVQLRPNVPTELADQAKQWLAGYYAHCTALDACVGDLLQTLREEGIEDDTIFIFTSDHGDMLGSQGHQKKQRPWDESLRVPFLLQYPALLGRASREVDALIDAPDIMSTLLGLCNLPIPETVEGFDFSGYLKGDEIEIADSIVISCPHPFGQWIRTRHGGMEYRGLRTRRYTYTRTLEGPWLLYDNEQDPYQLNNLANQPGSAKLQAKLEAELQEKLRDMGDEFLPGMEYIRRWNYTVNESGTVPYTN